MEDVLRVYQLPYDSDYPQVCLDETNKQLIGEVCPPLPGQPGQPYRYESHYLRAGVSQLFLWYEPLTGRRHVAVRDHKGAVDWAEVIAELLEVHYPTAQKVRLVMDQLNTHAGGSLYQASSWLPSCCPSTAANDGSRSPSGLSLSTNASVASVPPEGFGWKAPPVVGRSGASVKPAM